jgi:hypothetical protein
MKMAKAIRQQAATAERVAVNTADTYVVLRDHFPTGR